MGVFKMINDQYGPTGEGIETLLKSYGHNVINISKAGGSNWLMVDRLNPFPLRSCITLLTKVQTLGDKLLVLKSIEKLVSPELFPLEFNIEEAK